MKARFRWCVLAGWALAAFPGNGAWAAEATGMALTPAAVADFQWFGTLGFPDVKDGPVAHVATGAVSAWQGQTFPERFEDGFLLRHGDGGDFAVLTPELFTQEYVTTPATKDHHRVGYEPVPFAEAADAYLDKVSKESLDPGKVAGRSFRKRLSERAQDFVWAWACWRHGLDAQAARFYDRATSILIYHREGPEPKEFRTRLANDLGYATLWRATLDFGDLKVTRPQLLEAFERVARNYPGTEYADRARETADTLRRMVAEDAAHAAKPAGPLESLPPDERVALLVFRLRDQHGRQISQPGACNIFFDDEVADNNPPSPAAQLAALGTAAVPGLIAALDDKTLSRSVGFWRDFTFSHYVLTVGDCAEQILDRISGRQFFRGHTTSSYMGKDEQTQEVKKAVEAWWKTVQTKGERQTLIDTVRAGGEDGMREAWRLAQRYPDAGVEPLIAGAKRSEGWDRGQYVRTIGGVPGDEALAFLREEMNGGPHLGSRVLAAQAVARRGHGAEAVAAMVAAWEKRSGESAGTAENRPGDVDDSTGWLIRFLAGSGSVEAVEALGHDLGKQPGSVRRKVVGMFDPNVAKVDESTGEGATAKGSGLGLDDPEKVNAAVEALLAAQLEEATSDPAGTGGSARDESAADESVSDQAATMLTLRRPGKYRFDPKAPPKARARQRVECLNVWRAEHGLTAVPPPVDFRSEPALEEAIQRALQTLAHGQDMKEVKAAREALTKMGLSALGPIGKYAASLPPDDKQGRGWLNALEKTLACTVVETKVEGLPLVQEAVRLAVQERVEALKGKGLTAEEFVACVTSVGTWVPKGLEAFRLEAVRDEDLSGVRVTLTIQKSTAGTRDPESVQTAENVVVNGERIYGASGGHDREYAEKAETYAGFAREAEKACQADARQPFVLSLSVWMGRP